MEEWQPRERDLKQYPHFDPVLTADAAAALANDPDQVAKHPFFPFIRFDQSWNKFAQKGEQGKPKSRKLRYAAHRDAAIFARYRSTLSNLYEAELRDRGLQDCVLAYRSIPLSDCTGGKSNIHFAYDAFERIRELGDCATISLDISKYFEKLDHRRLKSLWCKLLGEAKLPPDHFQVFKAVTTYAFVMQDELYRRLGHIAPKWRTRSGKTVEGFVTPLGQIPKLLCTGKEFRNIVAGGDGQKSLIQQNHKPYGIPQGAPISDLLANLYLIDFDTWAHRTASELGGHYWRYSDDLLFVLPISPKSAEAFASKVSDEIEEYGDEIRINSSKTDILSFEVNHGQQGSTRPSGDNGPDGLEYLGFRFDGRKVYLRDRTMSNLYRKVARRARREAVSVARRYPDKDLADLWTKMNLEELVKAFGRVERFEEKYQDYRNWTFWTYANRATKLMEPLGQGITHQISGHKEIILNRAKMELMRALERRKKGPSKKRIVAHTK